MITTFEPRHLPPPPDGGAVVSIGVFDGVHRGHQAILERNLARARELGARATVLTFRRHPKKVLLGREPRTLTSLEHRVELFRRLGVEHTIALPFDEEMRSTPAEVFVSDFLVRRVGARAFVLGFDSRFGRDREGTPELIDRLGLDVEVVDPVLVEGRPISSTSIREAIELGDLEGGSRMLGRSVAVQGTVVHGQAIGSGLGFPTANLNLHHELHPPVGVYACWAREVTRRAPGEDSPPRAAVTNIGFRPTLGGERPTTPVVEVHLLDFSGDLYGATLELEFAARLRGEMRFDGLDALRTQIARDVEAARAALGNPE